MRADFSVYESKRMLRRLLARAPLLLRLDPNAISLAILLPGALAAVALAQGWWPVAAASIAARMVLATLDGYVAEATGRRTRLGAYLNRWSTELSDVALLVALFWRADPPWALAVVAATWLVNVLGVLGPVAGGALQWVGPAAQADRLMLLLVASLAEVVVDLDWTMVCQFLVALLLITAMLRTARSVRELSGT